MLRRKPSQRPGRSRVLRVDLPSFQRCPDPGQGEHNVAGVGLEIAQQVRYAGHRTADQVVVWHRVEQLRRWRSDQRSVALQHHGDQDGQVGSWLWLRRPAQFVPVAQPLAVQELLAGRIAPRPDVALDDDAQFDRSCRSAASSCTGHLEQPLDEGATLRRGRPALEDNEDIEVAGRPQATKHGRAVQVRTEHVAAEDPTHQMHDAQELPSIRPARVSSSSAHKSTLDTPSCRSIGMSVSAGRQHLEPLGDGIDRVGLGLRVQLSKVWLGPGPIEIPESPIHHLAGSHDQRGLGLSKDRSSCRPDTTSRACRPRCVRLEARRPNTPPHGEGLGSLYADRYGLEVVNLRILGFSLEPTEPAHLWVWLSPGDTVRLVTAAPPALQGMNFTDPNYVGN
jgi:hypothetical protein